MIAIIFFDFAKLYALFSIRYFLVALLDTEKLLIASGLAPYLSI